MNRFPMLDRLADLMGRRISNERGRRKMAQRRFHDELRGRLPRSFQALDPGPPAPEHLLRTTAGMTEAEVEKWLNPDFYFRTGLEQMREFIHALDAVSLNIRTVGTTFELGCGSGRLLRHLRCIQGIRLVGSDVNGDCVKWCREHLPGIEFYQNGYWQKSLPSVQFLIDQVTVAVCDQFVSVHKWSFSAISASITPCASQVWYHLRGVQKYASAQCR